MSPPPPLLEARDLCKAFGDHAVLQGVHLQVPRAQITCLLGRSGGGKSVLLKCLARLMPFDSGELHFDGCHLGNRESDLAAFRRRCGFLFQGNALLDSLTALENVCLPLEQTTALPANEIRARAQAALEQLELGAFWQRHPGELSGGMQKRLALARALVSEPELLLFDEPTAGLDPLRRNAVFEMIVEQQQRRGFTAFIVTHDIQEALTIAHQVALLDGGRIVYAGGPDGFAQSQEPALCAFRDSQQSLLAATQQLRQNNRTTQS